MSRLVWIVVALLAAGLVAWLVARARRGDRKPPDEERLDVAPKIALEAPPAPADRVVERTAGPEVEKALEEVAVVEPAAPPVAEPLATQVAEPVVSHVDEPVARPALVPPAIRPPPTVQPVPPAAAPDDEVLPLEPADAALWSSATAIDGAADRAPALTTLLAPALRSAASAGASGETIVMVRFESDTAIAIARADAATLDAVARRRKAAGEHAGFAAPGWLGREASAALVGTVLSGWAWKRYLADLEARLPEIKSAANSIAPKLDPTTQSRLKAVVHDLSRFLREARDNYAAAIRKPVFRERIGEARVEAERLWQALQDRAAALRKQLDALANAPRYGEVQLERTVAHLHALHDERRIETLGARILAALDVLRLALGDSDVPRGAQPLDALGAAHRGAFEAEQALRRRLADCERSAKGPAYAGRGEFESNRIAARSWLAKLDAEPVDGAGRCLADARATLAAGFLDGEAGDWTLLLRCDREGRVAEARHARPALFRAESEPLRTATGR